MYKISYMEEWNGLSRIFGNGVSRILDFMLIMDYEYTKSEIARQTGLSRKTVYDVWPLVEKYNLVKQTRVMGNSKLYTINSKNPLVKDLKRLQKKLMFEALEKHSEKVVMKARG